MKDENKKKENRNKKDIKKEIVRIFSGFRLETWYFTIIFFLIVLAISLVVWRDSFYKVEPSQKVIDVFNSTQEDFEKMKFEATEAVEILNGRISRYEEVVDFSEMRELFMELNEDGSPKTEPQGESQGNLETASTEEKSEVDQGVISPEGLPVDGDEPGVIQ